MKFRISEHAKDEMERRSIPLKIVESVLQKPEQVIGLVGNKIYQSRFDFEAEKTYLVRVVVAEEADALVVVTVYRTSKVEKYWREP